MIPAGEKIGVYGKIPERGDFVRLGEGGPAVVALADWLQGAVDRVVRLGEAWPSAPFYFVFRDADPDAILVGVIAPSRDRAGRSFPLAIFASDRPASALREWSAAPRHYSAFLAGAAALARRAHGLELGALAEAARALPRPAPASLPRAVAERRAALQATGAKTLWAALGGPSSAFYALSTLLTASRQARAKETARARFTLHCPIARSIELEFWLLAAERGARLQRAPPAYVWDGRSLLLAFGAPPITMPELLIGSSSATMSQQTWSLLTTHVEAIARARDGLGGRLRAAIEAPSSSLLAVLEAIEAP